MQTRAMDMVAGSQEPLNTSVAGRCCSASLQKGTALVAQGFSAFQGARGNPWPPHRCASTIHGSSGTVPHGKQVLGSGRGAGSTWGAERAGQRARTPGCSPDWLPFTAQSLCFLTTLCILSTSTIDMGLERSHALLCLGQGLCGLVFQGESPLPLCSWWQKGPLCASGSVLLQGWIGTEQPQLGRKQQGGGRGGL